MSQLYPNLNKFEDQEFFDSVMNHLPIGMFHSDTDGNCFFVNEEWIKISGLTADESYGLGWMKAIHMDDMELVMKELESCAIACAQFNLTFRLINKIGTVYVYVRTSPIFDALGNIRFYLSTAIDITGQKLSEKKINQNNKLLEVLQKTQADFFSENNLDDTFNNLLSDILNLTDSAYGFTGEVLYKDGKPYFKTHAVTNIAWNDEIRTMYENHAEVGIEFHNMETLFSRVIASKEPLISNSLESDLRRGGSLDERPPLSSFLGLPVMFDKEVIGLIGIANRDGGYNEEMIQFLQPVLSTYASFVRSLRANRKKKWAEDELKKSHATLRSLISNLHDSSFLLFDKEFRIILAEGEEIDRNKNKQELIGKTIFESLPVTIQFEEYLSTALSGNRVDIEHVWNHKTFDVNFLPLKNEKDGIWAGMIVFRNITQKKKQEEQLLRAKEEAEQAVKTKTEFLSTMSHEIRTPMNAVIGMTQILLNDENNPTKLDNLKILQFSAENLLNLINDILDVNKIEGDQFEFEQVEYNLKHLLTNIIQANIFKAGDNGNVISLLIDEHIPEKLIGDPTRIGQIVSNLVSNAVKFTQEGSITVKTSLLELTKTHALVHFEINDTGIGIAADKHEVIFERFTQASSDTTRKYGGTGLGLSIAKRLLELMNSTIRVVSESGKGASFQFSLVLMHSERETNGSVLKTSDENDPKKLNGVKILLVEDNHINVLVTKKFIEKWGAQSIVAENGQIAVELVLKNNFDVILMDLQMPIMDGYTATKRIREFNKSIPIIAITAVTISTAKDMALASGMNEFISKPFDPQELYNKICKSLKYNTQKDYNLIIKSS